MAVESPFELLDLRDGESVSFRVVDWELGQTTITPAHAPEGKVVRVLRVHVPPEDKPAFPHYWDLTSAILVAQLVPQLTRGDLKSLRFTLTARGAGAKKRYSPDIRRAS